MRACEHPPTHRRDAEAKVRRYRTLCAELNLPLLVVLSGEPSTGLSAELVEDVLGGANPLTFVFDGTHVGEMDSGPIELRQTDAPPRFDGALSGVALLEVRDGADATMTVWPVASATRPLPTLTDAPITHRQP